MKSLLAAFAALALFTCHSDAQDLGYQIGAGIWDITGPAAQTGMMGYASQTQLTRGLHYRLRARAFVFAYGGKRVVFVSTDSCMIFTEVKAAVLTKLQGLYGDLYTDDNIILSGTHTHSGPAGFAYLPIYDLASYGFHRENFNTIVTGIVSAISMAHNKLSRGGRILINHGTLNNANINRSPFSYLANPESERAKYDANTDHNITVLRLEDENGNEIGQINWFAVHGTSMTNKNHLISGDNKGHASYLFEKLKNGNTSRPGFGPFVAAFGQSNEGDVSPNTRGAFCPDGNPCDFATSTCNGKSQGCNGIGPGVDQFDSARIIGELQLQAALGLYNNASTVLSNSISYVHTYVDMENVTVSGKFTSTGQDEVTCKGALGDAFAAGTTDGPGDFDFQQNTNSSKNPFWNFIAGFLHRPGPEQKACHAPKQILLDTGEITFPAPWTAKILPLSIVRLGELVIIAVPGEFTTMSGRRLRDTVRAALEANGAATANTTIVIAGLSNAYSHYITTYEEYGRQRYEGASTVYGPHTLAAYQQLYYNLATALATGTPVPPGPTPPDYSNRVYDFQPPHLVDGHPAGKPFGTVLLDAKASYPLNATATVQFVGANPRTDYFTQRTFLEVQRLSSNGTWVTALTDSDWETRFFWEGTGVDHSLITISWDIAMDTLPGQYRIMYYGAAKENPLTSTLTPFTGTTSSFQVA